MIRVILAMSMLGMLCRTGLAISYVYSVRILCDTSDAVTVGTGVGAGEGACKVSLTEHLKGKTDVTGTVDLSGCEEKDRKAIQSALAGGGKEPAIVFLKGKPGGEAAQATRDGAWMTAARGEMAGGRRGDGVGLPVPVANARAEAVLGRITARRQSNVRFLEPGKSLSISRTAIQSLKRPTVAVGATSSGKCRTKYGDLANYIPDDLVDLELELECSIDQTRARPELLRSFFHAAELELRVLTFTTRRSMERIHRLWLPEAAPG